MSNPTTIECPVCRDAESGPSATPTARQCRPDLNHLPALLAMRRSDNGRSRTMAEYARKHVANVASERRLAQA